MSTVDDLMNIIGRNLDTTGPGELEIASALESALQSSEQAGYERGRISGQERAALTTIMRRAESAKEPCGDDPESAAAIRNGKFASIAQMAAQGLGMVRGPTFEPEQAAEPVAWLYTYRKIGGDYCYSRADTWDSPPWPAAGFELVSTTPLYTSPPKREPLTEEQIVEIRDEHLPSQGEPFDCLAFARAIVGIHTEASLRAYGEACAAAAVAADPGAGPKIDLDDDSYNHIPLKPAFTVQATYKPIGKLKPPKREPLTHQQRVKIMREADSPLALILKTERAHGIGDE